MISRRRLLKALAATGALTFSPLNRFFESDAMAASNQDGELYGGFLLLSADAPLPVTVKFPTEGMPVLCGLGGGSANAGSRHYGLERLARSGGTRLWTLWVEARAQDQQPGYLRKLRTLASRHLRHGFVGRWVPQRLFSPSCRHWDMCRGPHRRDYDIPTWTSSIGAPLSKSETRCEVRVTSDRRCAFFHYRR